MIHEHQGEFARAHTSPKEEGSPVATTPSNYGRTSYDHREIVNMRSNYRKVLLTDNSMLDIDWDISATPPVSPAPSRLRDVSEAFGDVHHAADARTSMHHTPSSAKQESHIRNMGVCTISQAEAVMIFLAGSRHGSYGSRGKLSDRLSKELGITPKAVRDIWNLRTWARATRPHWTPSDEVTFTKSLAAFCNSKRKPTRQTFHNISRCTSINILRSQPDFQMPTYINSFDGEWVFDPSFIAQDFEAVLMEWNDIVGFAF
jgi:hypothetical protein